MQESVRSKFVLGTMLNGALGAEIRCVKVRQKSFDKNWHRRRYRRNRKWGISRRREQISKFRNQGHIWDIKSDHLGSDS